MAKVPVLTDIKQIGESKELARLPLEAFWALLPPQPPMEIAAATLAAVNNYTKLKIGLTIAEECSGPDGTRPAIEDVFGRLHYLVRITRKVAIIEGESLVVYVEVLEGRD